MSGEVPTPEPTLPSEGQVSGCSDIASHQAQWEQMLAYALSPNSHPKFEESESTFFRRLPVLLKRYPGRWVAHHGDTMVACGKTQAAVYRQVGGKYRFDECSIRLVDPGLLQETATEID
ncbi:hypothetical protein A3D88_00760 [Candidatus Peribacteria bacterium RIFCSPHIGHO2_02_FULL_52_16]|nr:MAG: hypothetical protein A2706_00830 [Candidatus Peribacteria bacterium RIFCSPHIGHO2_01_FULL_51_35]OGJ61200.1 MAG: hypothetical protein A3D88_00760 [Candidatus Peribacteria bacterium RIFCSPHIGHO2_02_FULL_52_16]